MKIWVIIGVIAVIAVGVGFAAQRGISYMVDEQDKVLTLANDTATAVTANWAPEDLKAFAWSDYYATLEKDGFAAWESYRLLGRRVELQNCLMLGMEITNGLGNAMAECAATFEKGAAAIRITVSNHTGDWRVTSFKVQL